jgi:hypothetical protein
MSESVSNCCFMCGLDHPVYSKYQYPAGCPHVGRTSPLPVAATPASPELSVEDQLKAGKIAARSDKAGKKLQFELSRAKTKIWLQDAAEQQRHVEQLGLKYDLRAVHADNEVEEVAQRLLRHHARGGAT